MLLQPHPPSTAVPNSSISSRCYSFARSAILPIPELPPNEGVPSVRTPISLTCQQESLPTCQQPARSVARDAAAWAHAARGRATCTPPVGGRVHSEVGGWRWLVSLRSGLAGRRVSFSLGGRPQDGCSVALPAGVHTIDALSYNGIGRISRRASPNQASSCWRA